MPHSEDARPGVEKSQSQILERREKIRIKNRRKMYLDRNPAYFTSPDLELADPLLYDRCVRRFQTAAEREADGKAKGYSGVLEADLYRSEAKLSAIKNSEEQLSTPKLSSSSSSSNPSVTYVRGSDGEVLPEDSEESPESKEEGLDRWKFEMTIRFLNGGDDDFEYGPVDESEEWDVLENMEQEEKWFDEEEAEWVGDKDGTEGTGWETGIQDF